WGRAGRRDRPRSVLAARGGRSVGSRRHVDRRSTDGRRKPMPQASMQANFAALEQTSRTRVAIASAIGSALEWYDFFIYGTAAALVFNEIFFPKLDPWSGTLAEFAALGVGFFARPIGGLVVCPFVC